jgi:hypothetical protein
MQVRMRLHCLHFLCSKCCLQTSDACKLHMQCVGPNRGNKACTMCFHRKDESCGTCLACVCYHWLHCSLLVIDLASHWMLLQAACASHLCMSCCFSAHKDTFCWLDYCLNILYFLHATNFLQVTTQLAPWAPTTTSAAQTQRATLHGWFPPLLSC